jgi:integrase
MHHGRVYTISCEALGAPPNKEGSYQLANAWWQRQVAGLKPYPALLDPWMDEMVRRKAWCIEHGQTAEAQDLDDIIQRVKRDPQTFALLMVNYLMNDRRDVWQDRLSRFTPAPADRTVGHWVGRFLAMRETEVKSGDISISSYDSVQFCLRAFRDWCNPDLPIDKLDGERWVEWYKTLQGSAISVGYKRKRLIFARQFIGWLIELGLIPGFLSLHSKRYRFGGRDHEVKPLTTSEVRAVVDKTSGILRLIVLLMLNCGLSQKDCSDLKPEEYADGRITRRRSKTKKRNTRIVSWKLWTSTQALLDEYGRLDGDHLLLTASGRPWVRDHLDEHGRRRKSDCVRSLHQVAGIGVPLSRLRQTSGDMIRMRYGEHVADHFLAHGQNPVDQAYFSRQQAELDEAVAWLGSEYGLA